MGLFGKAVKTVLTVPRDRDVVINQPYQDVRYTPTGITVDGDRAMGFVPFYACVRLLADTVASLPLVVYRRSDNGGRVRAEDHELYRLLHDAPNPEMTSFVWRQTMQSHLLTWGNCYSEIDRGRFNEIRALWPLRPDRMRVLRVRGERVYEYHLPDGRYVTLSADRVFHVPGLGFDGLVGYSPISLARQAVALGMAAEEWAARFYQNNATPSTVIKLTGRLNDMPEDAKQRLRNDWDANARGLSNAHRTAILEEGLDVTTLGVPAKDAQFIEVRRYQKNDMATFFRIPPHMIGDVERSTSWGEGIEEQGRSFVTYTLNPWLIPWEQQIKKDLVEDDVYAEFLRDALLQGNTEDRYKAYEIALRSGFMKVNDVLRRENLPLLPPEIGDVYYHSNNMIPVGGKPTADVSPAVAEQLEELRPVAVGGNGALRAER